MNWRDLKWYVVNLGCRGDRMRHAHREFARHGIRVERVNAFTPDQWPGDPEKVARMMATTPGAVGCYQSQMSIIARGAISGKDVVVCEDDVCFCDDLPERLQYIEDNLTWDWDIFYLGATFHTPGEWYKHEDCADWGPRLGRDAEPTDVPHFMRVYGEWGTYAYLVNGKNADKVLRLFNDNIHRARGIDHLAIILGDRLNAFCFVPGCAWQYDNQSNIGNGITEFSHFKSLGPYVWTHKMDEFDPTEFEWR
ncbi:MAG: glycosyltransferase family 25 protein [Planctomycetota bacterium]|jgi:GR25 family glycosyltransferase involved in LPS biosynthesis